MSVQLKSRGWKALRKEPREEERNFKVLLKVL